jgi:hypothetical protein
VDFGGRFFVFHLNILSQSVEICHNGFFHLWSRFFHTGWDHFKQPLQRSRLAKSLAMDPIHPCLVYTAWRHCPGFSTTLPSVVPFVLLLAMLLNMVYFSPNIPIYCTLFAIAPNWQFWNGGYYAIGKLNAFYIGC